MTITATALGSNSVMLDYTAGETIANMKVAIDTFLTAHGWTSYDAAPYYVYRALCKDGTTYKYLKLESHATLNYIYFRVMESWNNSTHVATNESAYHLASDGVSVSATALTLGAVSTTLVGKIIVAATQYYAIMYTVDNTDTSTNPHGLVELEISAPWSQTLQFGWFTVTGLCGQTTQRTSSLAYQSAFLSIPRVSNTTGAGATKLTGITTGPHTASFFLQGGSWISTSLGVGELLFADATTTNDPLSGKPVAYEIQANYHAPSQLNVSAVDISAGIGTTLTSQLVRVNRPMGVFIGLKTVCGAISTWRTGDTTTLKMDSNFRLNEATGSNTTCIVLKTYRASAAFVIPA
jgi:hypothetical protein